MPMPNDWPAAAQKDAPHSPPVTMRATNGTSAVRFGDVGSLSAINSPLATMENTTAAAVDPIEARRDPLKYSQPRCAAQATTAGAVNEGRPATIPNPIARAK